MRRPRTQTHPAEVGLARLVLANHVVAASVLLDRHVTLRTLLTRKRIYDLNTSTGIYKRFRFYA